MKRATRSIVLALMAVVWLTVTSVQADPRTIPIRGTLVETFPGTGFAEGILTGLGFTQALDWGYQIPMSFDGGLAAMLWLPSTGNNWTLAGGYSKGGTRFEGATGVLNITFNDGLWQVDGYVTINP